MVPPAGMVLPSLLLSPRLAHPCGCPSISFPLLLACNRPDSPSLDCPLFGFTPPILSQLRHAQKMDTDSAWVFVARLQHTAVTIDNKT